MCGFLIILLFLLKLKPLPFGYCFGCFRSMCCDIFLPLMAALSTVVPYVTMHIFLPLMAALSAVVPCVAMYIFLPGPM